MEIYADFNFYQETFKGTLIEDENSFNRMAIEASFFINEQTLGRIDIPGEEVKLATCAIAEVTHKEYIQNSEDQIASETVGPHSVSYVKSTKTAEEYDKEKLRLLRMYLVNTGLLYRGLSSWDL